MEKISCMLIISALAAIMLCGCSDGSEPGASTKPQSPAQQESTLSIAEESGLSCKEYAEKILGFAEFPAMEEVTDSSMLSSMIDVTTNDIKEYCVYHNLISVNLQEIIVIKSSDTKTTLKTLEDRKTTLIDQLAFYPEQKESAKATVIGSSGDICYLITHPEASEIEKKLKEIL